MKKLFLLVAFVSGSLFSFAGNDAKYKISDAAIDQLFSQSEDISAGVQDNMSSFADVNIATVNQGSGGQNVGGFLIRSFFCGFIALHRSYMGTNGAALWWMYFCIPVVGDVVNFVDFWWVVFMGEDAMNKFKNNSRYIVWME